MTDKNDFRYIKKVKGDLIVVRPKTEEEKKKSLFRDFIDTIREEWESMMGLLR
jgi:hypothetical protein